MLFNLGLALLFFLPVIESFNRQIALNLLLLGSIFVSLPAFAKKKLSFDFVDLLWLLVLLIFTVTTINSWSLSRSFIELLRYFAYFLIFVAIKYSDNRNLLGKFFIAMIITNSIILSFLFISSPILKLPLPENTMSLFYPVYRHSHIADILIFAIPLTIFLTQRVFFRFLSLFFLVILFLSASRGGMISLSFAFLFYFITTKFSQKAAFLPIKRILLLTTITIIFILSSFIYSHFLISENNKQNAVRGFYKPAFQENRFAYLMQAWQGFREFPIFGTGLDTFRYVSKIYQSTPNNWSWYAHNHFVQIFVETGFLGGILFSVLIISLLISAFKNIHNPQSTIHYQQGLFIATLASIMHSLIDFDWQYISIFLLLFISMAILSPGKFEKTEKKHNFLQIFLISIIIGMFMVPIFFEFDSNQVVTKADNLIKKNDLLEAKNILQKAYRFDYKNQEISQRLGDLEAKIGSSDSAHLWYKDAILQDQHYAENIIKNDLRLYLIQAKNALDNKDFKTGYNYLVKSIKAYPLFYQLASGDYFLFNANKLNSEKKTYEARKMLLDYINLVNKQINKKKLLPEEILFITANLRQNVY